MNNVIVGSPAQGKSEHFRQSPRSLINNMKLACLQYDNQNRAGLPNAFCTDALNASSANALERPIIERARVILG